MTPHDTTDGFDSKLGGHKNLDKEINLTEMHGDNVTGVELETESHVQYDNLDERRLVHKIDWRVMPFLWGYAVLSAVDVSA